MISLTCDSICGRWIIQDDCYFYSACNNKADSEYPDYLVKWESLPYSDATWEDGVLIVKKYDDKIREFREREESKRTPSKLCRVLKSRPKFVPLKQQPEFIGADEVLLVFFRPGTTVDMVRVVL